jgi:hypothetical protein
VAGQEVHGRAVRQFHGQSGDPVAAARPADLTVAVLGLRQRAEGHVDGDARAPRSGTGDRTGLPGRGVLRGGGGVWSSWHPDLVVLPVAVLDQWECPDESGEPDQGSWSRRTRR